LDPYVRLVASATQPTITCENDGTGSARFDHTQIVALIGQRCCDEIDRILGHPVELLGVRFTDALGRDVDGPITHGVTLVGFRLSARAAIDPPPFPRQRNAP
jgi:hypothetical protein